jgi:hypothetical protein
VVRAGNARLPFGRGGKGRAGAGVRHGDGGRLGRRPAVEGL